MESRPEEQKKFSRISWQPSTVLIGSQFEFELEDRWKFWDFGMQRLQTNKPRGTKVA
jgi:hypothetical protein